MHLRLGVDCTLPVAGPIVHVDTFSKGSLHDSADAVRTLTQAAEMFSGQLVLLNPL